MPTMALSIAAFSTLLLIELLLTSVKNVQFSVHHLLAIQEESLLGTLLTMLFNYSETSFLSVLLK